MHLFYDDQRVTESNYGINLNEVYSNQHSKSNLMSKLHHKLAQLRVEHLMASDYIKLSLFPPSFCISFIRFSFSALFLKPSKTSATKITLIYIPTHRWQWNHQFFIKLQQWKNFPDEIKLAQELHFERTEKQTTSCLAWEKLLIWWKYTWSSMEFVELFY